MILFRERLRLLTVDVRNAARAAHGARAYPVASRLASALGALLALGAHAFESPETLQAVAEAEFAVDAWRTWERERSR